MGWQGWQSAGKTAGTTGRSLRVEALQLRVEGSPYTGGIECDAHVQNLGWRGFVSAGSTCGSQGRGLRVEAFRIRLTGALAKKMDVWYRVHVQNVGWMGWASNGATAGTEGYGLRSESVQVVLVPRGQGAPASSTAPATLPQVRVAAHVAQRGWLPAVTQGRSAGTTGKSLAVEALRVETPGLSWSGRLECAVHVQNIGWKSWTGPGSTCGTTGRGLRTEAVKFRLTGDFAKKMDVWYRVHVQNIGWMGWTRNGSPAGTEGHALRVESVQVRLAPKGSAPPGPTNGAFRSPAQSPGAASRLRWLEQAGDASSLLVVVNKRRPLAPLTYTPADLRPVDGVSLRLPAADAYVQMSAAAAAAGVPIRARSGYRSYAQQDSTHRMWVARLGRASAERESARPGYSEHQTGLAVDVMPRGGACQDFGCFGRTPQASWLAANAGRFGFIVRYQAGQEFVTGFVDEPWHLRYVGVEAAEGLARSGARTVEEYLGLPAAPTY